MAQGLLTRRKLKQKHTARSLFYFALSSASINLNLHISIHGELCTIASKINVTTNGNGVRL